MAAAGAPRRNSLGPRLCSLRRPRPRPIFPHEIVPGRPWKCFPCRGPQVLPHSRLRRRLHSGGGRLALCCSRHSHVGAVRWYVCDGGVGLPTLQAHACDSWRGIPHRLGGALLQGCRGPRWGGLDNHVPAGQYILYYHRLWLPGAVCTVLQCHGSQREPHRDRCLGDLRDEAVQ